MDLKEIDLVDPDFNWYYQHKAKFIYKKTLKHAKTINNLIDVGAGSGFFSKYFQKRNPNVNVFCVDPFYSDAQLKNEKKLKFVRTIPEVKAEILLFIDVLEHVENDSQLIQEYEGNFNEDSLLVISVPAFQFLWSGHDEFLEHFRRYKLSDVRNLLSNLDFEIIFGSYIFSTIFPLVYLKRKLTKERMESDMKEFGKLTNFLLLTICKLEYFLPLKKLFGTSVFVIARKKHV